MVLRTFESINFFTTFNGKSKSRRVGNVIAVLHNPKPGQFRQFSFRLKRKRIFSAPFVRKPQFRKYSGVEWINRFDIRDSQINVVKRKHGWFCLTGTLPHT